MVLKNICLDSLIISTGNYTTRSRARDATMRGCIRVVDLSGINARDLEPEHIAHLQPDILVSDVSFISLKLALPRALELAADGAQGIFLVKPQFEVDP